jgi:hypothetical protein
VPWKTVAKQPVTTCSSVERPKKRLAGILRSTASGTEIPVAVTIHPITSQRKAS